ncbi:sensor histidine kinase [Intestinibacter bartlettii]|uniref:sensor histidine kinase n=1 Tax=Intestinibacter bartlettii TaxID=261299 RepID=UPI0006C3FD94|nr:sensor histidine kinase [Intestinibacter bartlettii]CUP21431.1 signal transduction histidine kinase [Intestinibacter bartlettii]
MNSNSQFLSVIRGYIKQNIKVLLLFIVFALVFCIVFSLYDLEIEAIYYSVMLCTFIGLIYICINFINYYKKHIQLYKLQNEISISLENLPSPKTLMEEDYTNLILNLNKEYKNYISKSDIAKSDMIDYYTMWVHQIKTPISALKLLIQTSESEISSDLSSELFKIEQYVEMVLSYIRLGSNKNDFVLKEYDLDNIIRQAVRKYAPLFIRKKISLDFQPTNYKVLTDEKWLVFVIEQLLSNAIKYTNKGKISIYSLENKKLVIEDTGIGISKEDIPRIFDKGFTGYNGRTDKKATGLGLYLCKNILDKLSHKISIESEVGVKTKVILDLAMVNVNIE